MGATPMTDKKRLTRHESREIVFQMLFAKEFDKEKDIADFYNSFVEDGDIPNNDYIKNTFLGVCESQNSIDEEIETNSIKWKMARMSIATRCALRLAVYEMTKTDLPPKASINEVIELVKKYDDENAPAFVNGILNKIARDHALIGQIEEQ